MFCLSMDTTIAYQEIAKSVARKKHFPVSTKRKYSKPTQKLKQVVRRSNGSGGRLVFDFPKKVKKSGDLINLQKKRCYWNFLIFFIQDIQELSLHLFNWKWHDQQFDYIKEHLQPSILLQVLDFAQNYMNKYQDEPKECHWDHSQTVLHPIINHRHCAIDGKLIVKEHVIISNDLNHDKHEVKAFENASMNELERSGFKPTHIMQFCDNCSSQYKLK